MDEIVTTDNVIGMSREDVIVRLNAGGVKWMVPQNPVEDAASVICVEANQAAGMYFSLDFDAQDRVFRVRTW